MRTNLKAKFHFHCTLSFYMRHDRGDVSLASSIVHPSTDQPAWQLIDMNLGHHNRLDFNVCKVFISLHIIMLGISEGCSMSIFCFVLFLCVLLRVFFLVTLVLLSIQTAQNARIYTFTWHHSPGLCSLSIYGPRFRNESTIRSSSRTSS